MKIFGLLLLVSIFLTDALEVTDEDGNSPLLSYLLAKVQRLETKQMVGIRNTRQTTEKHTKPPAIVDNKQCNCQSNLVT